MLFTVTYQGHNTQDLGYLLHKNPSKAQKFELNYGCAYVFYPEVSDERTTAALLLDINPIDLARGKVGSAEGGLFDYVNDRPYAASSFMSTAISKVFGTAMGGRSKERAELAATPLCLTACIYSVKDGGEENLAAELFEPLGYTVETVRAEADDEFGDWGRVPYVNITLHGTVRLSELLNHIYVLLPVFDRQKHYYTSEDEIQKLLDHGAGWLNAHPQRDKIVNRYFAAKKSYAKKAIDILLENDGEDDDKNESDDEAEEKAARTPLNTERLKAVKAAVLKSGAESVIDMGCGECRLTSMLLPERQIKRLTACDVSVYTLEKAAKRLRLDRMNVHLKSKLILMQASLTYRDKRFSGYDCACIVEVVEHIEPMRIPAFERVVFEFAAPKTVIVTTPNREYNANYASMRENALRHGDHRFEWSRAEFEAWTRHVCAAFGYSCDISGIGDNDDSLGCPTQMGVFTKA